MTAPQVAFELDYWLAVREGHQERYRAMLAMWGFKGAPSALEVGTGPYSGMLPLVKAERKVGIDPLYPQYADLGLFKPLPGIAYLPVAVEDYPYEEQFDA